MGNTVDEPIIKPFEVAEFSFDDMHLQVGDKVQIEVPGVNGSERHFTTMIGYLEGESLLLRTPLVNGLTLPLPEGTLLTMRVFSGLAIFIFSCKVMRVCVSPFPYVHLSFPAAVRGAIIRKAERVIVNISARIAKSDAREFFDAVVINIGTGGALVDAPPGLGAENEIIQLRFNFNLGHAHYDASLAMAAAIHRIMESAGHDAAGQLVCHYGVEFQELRSSESILLQSLVYQRLFEDPQ